MELTLFPNGRVQTVDGERYYSPNSLIDPPLLLKPLEEGLQNIFLPHRRGKERVRYREYVHPRLWTLEYAWIPFVPVNPYQWFDNCSYMGRVLSKYPPLEHFTDESGKHHGWAVACENEWSRLEADLYKAIRTLSATYKIPCSLPFLPSAIGYQGTYTHKRSLTTRLDTAREWFFVFFGALSYLAAMLRLSPDNSGIASEEWLPILHSAGISPTFVDGIHTSLVYEVSQDLVRWSGVVLDLLNPPKGQPDPNWFITMGVPVWYRWGRAEEGQSSLEKWSPPRHLLGQDLSMTPALPAGIQAPPSTIVQGHVLPVDSKPPNGSDGLKWPTQISSTSTSPPPIDYGGDGLPLQAPPSNGPTSAPMAVRKDPEWVEFFAIREQAHQKLLKTETPKAQQVRENRTREPATASAKVFEWFESDKEGVLWERVPVLAKARLDTLHDYGEGQKRYDPFFNEWDIRQLMKNRSEQLWPDNTPQGKQDHQTDNH